MGVDKQKSSEDLVSTCCVYSEAIILIARRPKITPFQCHPFPLRELWHSIQCQFLQGLSWRQLEEPPIYFLIMFSVVRWHPTHAATNVIEQRAGLWPSSSQTFKLDRYQIKNLAILWWSNGVKKLPQHFNLAFLTVILKLPYQLLQPVAD